MDEKLRTVQQVLKDYGRNPTQYPLHRSQKLLADFVLAATTEEKKRLRLNINCSRNLFHVAVYFRDVQSIQILKTLLTDDQILALLGMKDIGGWDRFRGSLVGQNSKCLTPVLAAVLLWGAEGGDSKVYDELIKDLPEDIRIRCLMAVDEQCKNALRIACETEDCEKRAVIKERIERDLKISGKCSYKASKTETLCLCQLPRPLLRSIK